MLDNLLDHAVDLALAIFILGMAITAVRDMW